MLWVVIDGSGAVQSWPIEAASAELWRPFPKRESVKNFHHGWERWHTPVILELGRLRQEDRKFVNF